METTIRRAGSLALLGTLLWTVAVPGPAYPAVVEVDLTVAEQTVNLTGEPVTALTLNGGIPGPVLRFTEGDTARIRVNNLLGEDTSVHWHGVLVPPGMDGVPYISFPSIAPGTTFTYEFPIRQAGTYWYHSHSGHQEQRGVYGAIVIEPRSPQLRPDRDHVVVLSDWTDEAPGAVQRTLKRGSEWYALAKGSSQSLFGAARLGMLGAHGARELQRMPPMDIADVAYDRFLANGTPETSLAAAAGEKVRLRMVDGSSTTYFHLSYAGGPLTIVAADGQDVEPVEVDRLLIAVAETYDLLVKIPGDGAYELRATAHDGSAWASVWLGAGERHPAPPTPRPNVYHAMGGLTAAQLFALTPAGAMGMPDRDVDAGRFDAPGMEWMEDMGGMHHGMGHSAAPGAMDHSGHGTPPREAAEMPHGGHAGHGVPPAPAAEPANPPPGGKRFASAFRPLAADASSSPELAQDGIDPRRPWPPYDKLRAAAPTAFAPDRPVREVRLTLDGDMERYVWMLGGRVLAESDDLLVRQGEVARFILINRTMMHHPMHLHGHFFRVVNGQGNRAPLKHTVDVAPMSTTVIEFDANEFGDWFFHCHLLYHMESGMARVVHYEGFWPALPVPALRPQLYRDPWYAWGQADALTQMTQGFLQASNTRNIVTAGWEVGWQHADATEWEALATWDRYVNRFFTFFGGADLLGENRDVDEVRAVAGVHYLLPLNLESRAWVDSEGGARISLERELQLLPRLSLAGEVEYDTHDKWEGRVDAAYTLTRALSLLARWHSEYLFGVGVQLRF